MSKHANKARRHRRRMLDKKRLVVKLSTLDDYPHNDVVLAEVRGWGAHEWADWDGYINGDSWETARDMPGYAYAMPGNHAGLVEELRAEGYELDLSEYEEFNKDCEDVGCEDEECPARCQECRKRPASHYAPAHDRGWCEDHDGF
jgi:hypothetical protein